MDKNRDAFRRLGPDFAGDTVTGIGFDRKTLLAAGVERADALAAVTSGDNSNIVTARVARENFAVSRVVARIYDPRRAEVFQKLGIPTVATVSWATDQVLRRLLANQQPTDWLDQSGRVALVEISVPPALAGTKVAELNDPGAWWLTALTRLGTARVATGDQVIQEGDLAHFMVDADALPRLTERMSSTKAAH